MFHKLLVVTVISIVATAPISDDAHATIIKYTNTNDGRGNYEFSYKTSNGLARSETGRLVNAGQPDEHIMVQGMYSYIDSDGEEQVVRYTADENGYVVDVQPARPPVMFRVLLLVTVISMVAAAPISDDDDAQAKIIEYKNTNDGSGNYEFSYKTSNGLARSETGRLVNAGQPDEHIAVEGIYSYIDSNGEEQVVRYTADENGYVVITLPAGLPPVGGVIFSGPPSAAVLASLLG